jgi:hypothetical protein
METTKKIRCTFMIEPDILDKLRSIKERTGLSESEQIRQGIRWWLDSREWPAPAPAERLRASVSAVPADSTRSSKTPRAGRRRRTR